MCSKAALLISYFDTEQRPRSKRAPSTVSGLEKRHFRALWRKRLLWLRLLCKVLDLITNKL